MGPPYYHTFPSPSKTLRLVLSAENNLIYQKAPGKSSPRAKASISHALKNTHFQAANPLIFPSKTTTSCGFIHHSSSKTTSWHLNYRSLMCCCGGIDATCLYFIYTLSLQMYIHKYIIFLILHQSRPD